MCSPDGDHKGSILAFSAFPPFLVFHMVNHLDVAETRCTQTGHALCVLSGVAVHRALDSIACMLWYTLQGLRTPGLRHIQVADHIRK